MVTRKPAGSPRAGVDLHKGRLDEQVIAGVDLRLSDAIDQLLDGESADAIGPNVDGRDLRREAGEDGVVVASDHGDAAARLDAAAPQRFENMSVV